MTSKEYIEQLDFLKVSNSVTDLKDEINTFVDQYKDQYKGVLHIGDLSEELKIKANKIDRKGKYIKEETRGP